MTNTTNWTRFWQLDLDQICLPNAEKSRQRIFDYWDDVASGLTNKAHVLDLGCGSGVLSEHLANQRSDISLTGIDIAEVKDSAMERVSLKSGVDMADLPLDDGSVDTAVSMFGVEYGDPQTAGPELARVLKSSASFSFVAHHAGSPVVTKNKGRGEMLGALIDPKIGKALIDQDRDSLVRQMFDLRHHSGTEAPLVDEVARGLGQAFDKGKAEREAVWNEFSEKADVEIGIINALQDAAISDPRIWAAKLGEGFDVPYPTYIASDRDERIAWVISGKKV